MVGGELFVRLGHGLGGLLSVGSGTGGRVRGGGGGRGKATLCTHVGLIGLLALESLESVPVEHDARGQWADDEPVDGGSDDRGEDQQTLSALLARGPVRFDERGGDERGVEVQVGEEQGRGGECLEGEVERGETGLQGPEGLSRERGVAPVPGLWGRSNGLSGREGDGAKRI